MIATTFAPMACITGRRRDALEKSADEVKAPVKEGGGKDSVIAWVIVLGLAIREDVSDQILAGFQCVRRCQFKGACGRDSCKNCGQGGKVSAALLSAWDVQLIGMQIDTLVNCAGVLVPFRSKAQNHNDGTAECSE
jgi:hypothetical protein